jgi:hypothetical protein
LIRQLEKPGAVEALPDWVRAFRESLDRT